MSSDILDVLPVSLDLIRIPRHRVPALVGAILRQLLASGDDRTFLALTANEIELSIFGVGAAGAFAPIARRDARKAASAAGQTWEPVEVSTNKWKVIQIPSPDDSGAHLHEVCAPIAAAGISILYHSSHQNDFIFVKELHLRDVLVLLAGVGFTPMDSTLPIEPISPTGAVLTRPHSNSVSPIGRSRSSTASSVQTFASALPSPGLQGSSNPEPANVRILTPTLTCIGLPSEDSDAWVLKLVKLITCPDLIIPSLSSGPLDGLALELDSPFAEFDGEHPDSPISPDSSEEDIEDEEDLADLPDEHFVTTSEGPTVGIQRSIRRPTLTHRATLTSSDPDRAPNRPTDSRAIAAAPYFSFTRAPEGASLTSSVSLLAALFPSGSARFGLSCANALDSFDGPSHSRSSSSSHGTARGGPGEGRLCLQIDLRKYALDAHGLVHRFTTALAAHQIEHVYSSTFRTANILVNSDDAEKASALIALC